MYDLNLLRKALSYLNSEEEKIRYLWRLLKLTLKEIVILQNVWDPKVQAKFAQIKDKLIKLKAILVKFHDFYKTDESRYKSEINKIEELLGLLSNIKSNEAWIEELHDDMESILKAIEAERVRAQKMSRRMFIGTSVVAAASAAGLYRAGVFDKTETKERELLENFLSPSEVPLTRKEIEVILYDIEDKDGTVGRAVHIGGNYFITANHVVSRGVVGKRLLPQHRRGYQWDFFI